ncbi:MAG: sulfite exporter TauE/SafE family protein [Gammaproteobacteria bacterium]|nr:sulfite exporter TauE/SafE family protein [Gammaproteobacteria bacterium]
MLGNFTLTNVIGLVILSVFSGIVTGMMTMGGGLIQVSGMMMIFGYGIILVRPVVYITNIFTFAASAYRSKMNGLLTWRVVAKIIPWVIIGVIFGYIIGNELGDKHIAYLIGFLALILSVKTVLELMGVKQIGAGTENAGKPSDKENTEESIAKKDRDAEDSIDDLLLDEQIYTKEALDEITAKATILNNDAKGVIWFKGLSSIRIKNALLGIPVGFVSGVLGIPGGILGVPLQQHLFGSSLHRAIANSSIIGFFAALTGVVVALTHGLSTGLLTWTTILSLSAIMIPGAYLGGMLGSKLLNIISITWLRWVYLLIMLLVAGKIFFV